MGSSSPTRDWTHALFLGAQSLSHWTTREVPVIHGPFDGLKYPLSSSCMHAKSLQSYLTLCDTMDYSPPGSSVHEDSPVKNTGVGFHALLQGIFLTPVVTQVQKSENSILGNCIHILPWLPSFRGNLVSNNRGLWRTKTEQAWWEKATYHVCILGWCLQRSTESLQKQNRARLDRRMALEREERQFSHWQGHDSGKVCFNYSRSDTGGSQHWGAWDTRSLKTLWRGVPSISHSIFLYSIEGPGIPAASKPYGRGVPSISHSIFLYNNPSPKSPFTFSFFGNFPKSYGMML